jgi:hypothetical protein
MKQKNAPRQLNIELVNIGNNPDHIRGLKAKVSFFLQNSQLGSVPGKTLHDYIFPIRRRQQSKLWQDQGVL